MKFEFELQDKIISDMITQVIESDFNDTKYRDSFGTKMKGIIETVTKSALNMQLQNFEPLIKQKIEENIERVINEIVSQRLEGRVKKILGEQLKIKDI